MKFKIIFVNPNTEKEMGKYLPEFLAEALINKIERECREVDIHDESHVQQLA